MAEEKPEAASGEQGAGSAQHRASGPASAKPEGARGHRAHPTWATYKWIALILTVITIVEVWVYYTPFTEHRLFVPTLLLMSATKFAIVVIFYMHLKYDAKIFRALFTGPLIIAIIAIVSLLLLFEQLDVFLE